MQQKCGVKRAGEQGGAEREDISNLRIFESKSQLMDEAFTTAKVLFYNHSQCPVAKQSFKA